MALSENIIDGRKWTYFADTVMGGISTGGGGFDQSASALHLYGNVSTANNQAASSALHTSLKAHGLHQEATEQN